MRSIRNVTDSGFIGEIRPKSLHQQCIEKNNNCLNTLLRQKTQTNTHTHLHTYTVQYSDIS